MSLPELDAAYLIDRAIEHEVVVDGGMICVLIRNYPLPQGYDYQFVDLLLRLSPGYPDVAPDMWWFSPSVKTQSGQDIPQTQSIEIYLGKSWQRWSRHFEAGRWDSSRDSLETFLAVIKNDLLKYSAVAA